MTAHPLSNAGKPSSIVIDLTEKPATAFIGQFATDGRTICWMKASGETKSLPTSKYYPFDATKVSGLWTDITPAMDSAAFFINQCNKLPGKADREKCNTSMMNLFLTIGELPQLPNSKPIESLYTHCESLNSRRTSDLSFRKYVLGLARGVPAKELERSPEGLCKRSCRNLHNLLGSIDVNIK